MTGKRPTLPAEGGSYVIRDGKPVRVASTRECEIGVEPAAAWPATKPTAQAGKGSKKES